MIQAFSRLPRMGCAIARRAWLLLAALAFIACVSGCMTEPPDNDLPWNKPQSWEGTPAMPPGLFQKE